jgi:acyl-CoA thioesterase-1
MEEFFKTGGNTAKRNEPGEVQHDRQHDTDVAQRVKNILFLGDSLTAGYGLRTSEAFPALIQQKIDGLGLRYKAINAGVSGDTSAGGDSRVSRFLDEPVDVFVLELGVNDGLRGIPVAETKKHLQSIINKVSARHPRAKLVLAGMILPPYFANAYLADFQKMYPELAEKNGMALIPFLLNGVGGVRALNLPDGAHPSAKGQKIVAENVWAILKDVLE